MSTRSTTEASSAPPRRRFGLPRLADVRIRSKLGLILIVPVVALIGVASVRLVESSGEAISAEQARTLTEFTQSSSELINSLQTERARAAIQLHKDNVKLGKKAESLESWEDAAADTDKALKDFKTARSNVDSESTELKTTLDDVVDTYDGYFEESRERIAAEKAGAGDLTTYTSMVNTLTNVYEYAINNVTDPKLNRELRATRLIVHADEASEQMRLLMLNLSDSDKFTGEQFRTFVTQLATRDRARVDFDRTIDRAANLSVYDSKKGLDSDATRAATNFEESVASGSSDDEFTVNHSSLVDAYNERHAASIGFIDEVQTASVDHAEAANQAVVSRVLIEIAVVLITLVVAVLLALVIASSLASSLRRLREGALEVAHVGLPAAVASMRESETAGQRSPQEIVASIEDPLRMDNRDEVGTVAGAFNTVHREAVRIAAEQAALRSSVSTMFVNLARRSQNLVDRLIGHLDRLERGEEDPDRLGELFQLDHLATRMRRNDENLLVMAGADSTRVERNAAQIGDVLRAAQSEVEYYTRIEFGTVLADAEVEAAAVNDIVHLVAELLDNATSFSPPDTAVVAEARQVRDEIVVRITDRGIGISEEQLVALNQQLSEPADVDITASRMMGLVVVARLARRHNIRVTLQQGAGRGTIAEMIIPPGVLTSSAERESRPSPGPSARITGELPRLRDNREPEPSPSANLDAPASLFEPINLPDPEQVEPFAPRMGANGSASDHSGGHDDETGRPREVTGEIVSEGPPDIGPVALPMIRLDASPEPPATGAPSDNGRESAPSQSPSSPPSWPASEAAPTNDPVVSDSERAFAADETMELPIFREVESAWFKTGTPAPRPAADASAPRDSGSRSDETTRDEAAAPPRPREVAAEVPQATEPDSGAESTPRHTDPEIPRRRTLGRAPDAPEVPEFDPATGDSTGSREGSWRTAADHGWQVAAEVGEKEADEATEAGLPRRRPMERLVPGSVEPAEPEQVPKPRRDPEGVRGLLSAYHRGVQRGRGDGS